VAGWALSQGIAQVLPVFECSDWAIRLIVVLVIICLRSHLYSHGHLKITPEGIKRTGNGRPGMLRRREEKTHVDLHRCRWSYCFDRIDFYRSLHGPEYRQLRLARASYSFIYFAKSIAVLPRT